MTLIEALLQDLRADPRLQSLFGTPPRIYDDETRAAIYPYANLDRLETTDASASVIEGAEHQVQFGIYSRHGGLREAKDLIEALKAALEKIPLAAHPHRLVLTMITYCDVMRTQNPQIFRGVLRARLITEEV